MKGKSRFAKELGARKEKDQFARSKPIASTRPMPRQRDPLELAVATQRQTPEEQRHFEAALDVFLSEMVRQHLGPQK
jgi:hypothetical protein